jgi:hypothetical protein
VAEQGLHQVDYVLERVVIIVPEDHMIAGLGLWGGLAAAWPRLDRFQLDNSTPFFTHDASLHDRALNPAPGGR